jgi:hypothetical protein
MATNCGSTKRWAGVTAVETSDNAKLGKGTVSATYAAQVTCSPTCPALRSYCYAEGGQVGMHTARFNRSAKRHGLTPAAVTMREARAIDQLSGRRPLRLHVVGDARTTAAARCLARAAARYTAKHGRPVWTYTHSWRTIARAAWGSIGVAASTESLRDAARAMRQGYGATVVVREFVKDTAYRIGRLLLIPCPEQTGRAASCERCRLCFDPDALRARGAVIAFRAHGQNARRFTPGDAR